ncbi:hypothetical protein Daura_15505 [Dactylosporangium aurantiacum]|uniref:Lecithin:cholesterol acyltransferase n=1 Tax=Dactylosporangium aurantiacum TaxID=35754 RepID=A0A9Q9IQE2_9ACTN|nr:hypothetical protein [Dactylosporangium aurantiacum]MDG6107787.1 hypothetical protein [Dactylosporangium aurantiacum]UWZ57435.1 hypothetical protein Daura_15505 [Dactylosporangium aurantiacum]
MKRRLRDVIVVLPGITGSVLERGGRTIWGPSHRLIGSTAAKPARAVRDLSLGDDADVSAVKIMPDAHMVGGLVKIDGYSRLIAHIERNFIVERATADGHRPANLIEFPYDWRLDNRLNARRLLEVAVPALERWRHHAQLPEARLILLAHSMGGLVARYFMEVLEGWRYSRALVTFGTPFLGSLEALGYLANGYKRLHVDLTEAMRSFPSVYQLMPVYPALRTAAGWQRVAETVGIPNVDPARAADALRFHREIEAAVAANDREDPRRYALLPVVGTHQPTNQSATLEGGTVTLGVDLPEGVDAFFTDEGIEGDGTVPICSASPADMGNVYSDMYQPAKHSALQVGEYFLGDLVGKLAKMQAQHPGKLRGPLPPGGYDRPCFSVAADDAFGSDEPVSIAVRCAPDADPLDEVRAEIESLDSGERWTWPLKASGDSEWSVTVGPLAPGGYRFTVTGLGGGNVPVPVSDLFEVGGA